MNYLPVVNPIDGVAMDLSKLSNVPGLSKAEREAAQGIPRLDAACSFADAASICAAQNGANEWREPSHAADALGEACTASQGLAQFGANSALAEATARAAFPFAEAAERTRFPFAEAVARFQAPFATSPLADSVATIREQTNRMGAQFGTTLGSLHENLGLAAISERIAEQQKAFDGIRLSAPFGSLRDFEDRSFPELPIVTPNPIHETNERLASIEDRFNRMEAIAVDSAEIATSLQASAAKFLAKFEQAATDNDRTARRGLRLAILAICLPLAQLLYTELWRAPHDAAQAQAVITGMRAEVAALQEAQLAAAHRTAEAVAHSDDGLAAVLADIRALLANAPGSPAEGTVLPVVSPQSSRVSSPGVPRR